MAILRGKQVAFTKPSFNTRDGTKQITENGEYTIDTYEKVDVQVEDVEGIDDLRDALGFTGHPIFDDATTPELIAQGVLQLNYSGILLLENKGVDPYSINNNTWDVLEAISRIPTGGGGLSFNGTTSAVSETPAQANSNANIADFAFSATINTNITEGN